MLSAQFTATVTVGLRFISFTETRTSTGPDPVSESLSRTFCEGDSGYFMCERPNPLFVGELHAARRLACWQCLQAGMAAMRCSKETA